MSAGVGEVEEAEGVAVDLADHRPAVYREGSKWVFRASTFGSCDASLVREALGQQPMPPPEVIRKAYAAGVRHEPAILRRFCEGTAIGSDGSGWSAIDGPRAEQYGHVDSTGQLVCDLAVGPRAVIRCHPDAVVQCYRAKVSGGVYRPGDRLYLEAKALSLAFTKPMSKPEYRWQLAIEAAATGLPGKLLVGWKDKEGELASVEAITPVHLPSVGEVKARARHLLKLIDAAEDGVVPACDWAMWPCGFWQLHDMSVGSVHCKAGGELGDEDERHAKALVFEWRKARKQRGVWAKKEDEARAGLQELLEGAGVARWSGGGASVAYYPPAVQRRFDIRRAEEAGVDVGRYMSEVKVKAHVRVNDDKAGEG